MWSAWVDPDNKPVRACVAAPMAHEDILVEVMVVAAANLPAHHSSLRGDGGRDGEGTADTIAAHP